MSKWRNVWVLEKEDGTLATGWNQVGDYWYYFFSSGVMATEWNQINNNWYYFNKDGQMQTGWYQDSDSKWYYLEPNSTGNKGAMYTNGTYNIEGKSYKFDIKGIWIPIQLVSNSGINFIKSYEGFSATKYDDGTGVITQGYGCIGDEIAEWGDTITEQVASDKLKDLIENKYANVIKNDLDSKSITLKQNEFDSICSMAYNIGTTGMLGSTLYSKICQGIRDESLKDNFIVWSKAGGKTMQGLLNRRIEEYQLFANGDYTRNL